MCTIVTQEVLSGNCRGSGAYPGPYADCVLWSGCRKRVFNAFWREKAQIWARHHNRPLYLGEFGAYDKGDMASRVRWTSFVTQSAEKLGWSWGYWQFDGDFIVYDMKSQKWVEPIRDALIPPYRLADGKGRQPANRRGICRPWRRCAYESLDHGRVVRLHCGVRGVCRPA